MNEFLSQILFAPDTNAGQNQSYQPKELPKNYRHNTIDLLNIDDRASTILLAEMTNLRGTDQKAPLEPIPGESSLFLHTVRDQAGQLVAFARLAIKDSNPEQKLNEPFAFLSNLYVHPDQRKQNIATVLGQEMIKQIDSMDIKMFFADLEADNYLYTFSRAKKIGESFGFSPMNPNTNGLTQENETIVMDEGDSYIEISIFGAHGLQTTYYDINSEGIDSSIFTPQILLDKEYKPVRPESPAFRLPLEAVNQALADIDPGLSINNFIKAETSYRLVMYK